MNQNEARELPEWLQLEVDAINRDTAREHRRRVALAAIGAAMALALGVALTGSKAETQAAPTPAAAQAQLEAELARIEAQCVAAQRANPHQLSCDWGSIDEARQWERQYRGVGR